MPFENMFWLISSILQARDNNSRPDYPDPFVPKATRRFSC
jgi:hypothetical protein